MSDTFDYHTIVDIDTPKEERYKLRVGDIYSNEAECKLCGDRIRSKNRHDFRRCTCGALAVDGGSHYLKRSGNINDCIELSKCFNDMEEDHD